MAGPNYVRGGYKPWDWVLTTLFLACCVQLFPYSLATEIAGFDIVGISMLLVSQYNPPPSVSLVLLLAAVPVQPGNRDCWL